MKSIGSNGMHLPPHAALPPPNCLLRFCSSGSCLPVSNNPLFRFLLKSVSFHVPPVRIIIFFFEFFNSKAIEIAAGPPPIIQISESICEPSSILLFSIINEYFFYIFKVLFDCRQESAAVNVLD